MSDDNPFGGGGGMPDLSSIMNMAQKLQGDVAKVQEDLERLEVEASAGGGMVKATVNGKYQVVKLDIEKTAVDPDDLEMLQDLVIAAVNQGIEQIREKAQAEMGKVTGGLAIPGMGNMF